MRNFWLILSVLWLWTCSGGGDGDNTTGPEEPPIVINLTSLGGQAQKGPFNNGTAINVAELTNTLSPTGRNFSTAITDNTGRFAVANVELESPYVELRANGYYFNEVANEISSGQLTLFALSNLTGKTSLNVNILTHLEKNRMVTLMSGDNPKTFAQAKLQAQEEVLAIFDYSRANVPESELLDISQSGAANAKLLAMSAIIQGDLTVGQMSQLLANLSTDIASDGTLDDTNLRNTLIENSKNLDIAQVRSHLEAHYSSLGVSANIADFETEVNQFLKPPEAQDISVTIAEDTQINITLAGSDPEGESLTYTILEVNNAAIILDGDVANYTPNANFNGTDTFTYYANDGTSDSNIATVTITISAEDDDPNTLDVATTTDEDVAVVVNLSAEEYDGDSYSFGIIDQPSNGAVSLDGVNATYTPNQDYNGTDSFTFEATDDTGRMMNVGTATITINPVNDAPVITTTSLSFSEVGQKWLANVNERDSFSFTVEASDIDGDPLTFQWSTDTIGGGGEPVAGITDGDVDINGSEYTYTALDCFCGTGQFIEDGFSFYVNDNSGSTSNYEYVVFTVDGVNDAPVTTNITQTQDEENSEASDLSSFTSDVDGDDLTYSIVTDTTNGTTSIDGSIVTYTPNANYNGTDSYTYKANDGTVDSNIATVSINVNPVIDPLVSIDISLTVNEDESLTEQIDSRYASSPDGLIVNNLDFPTAPTNGTVSNNGRELTYTPNLNWNGTETFTYRATGDDSVWSNESTITITVNPVDDLPTAIDFTASTAEDVSVDITLQYEDVDGDVWSNLTYDYLGGTSNGSVTMNSAKTIATYTPNSGFFGTDQFKYSTEGGSSVEGTVTITVKEVVGTLKLYPDLTSDYNEWFHDIVYDETTGGFIVAGISIDKNDSGSGGTKEMFHLRQDSSLDGSPQYETISTTLNSWGNPSNTINNSAHQFGISERSLSSNYLLSTRSDYLWLVDSNGGVTYKQLSGTLDSTYGWVDNIIQSYPTSDGGFLVFGTTSKQSNNQARYPVIAKLDASLNVDYFKVLDSHVANTSWAYYAQAQGMVQAGDGVYYLVAGTNRTGISNSHAIQFYKVEDSGSALSITQHVDLSSSISNSPTSFTSSDDFDTMAYLPGTSSSDAEFVIVTDNNELTRYNIDSSGNAQIKGTFDLNGYRNANYIEIVGASTSFYIVAQTDSGSGSPNINVAKLSDNLSVAWEKTLDITSLSQGDKLGGATSIQFGQSSTGIAITGSTQSSSGDWDGFILLLDDNGSRIY